MQLKRGVRIRQVDGHQRRRMGGVEAVVLLCKHRTKLGILVRAIMRRSDSKRLRNMHRHIDHVSSIVPAGKTLNAW